VPGATQDLGD